MYAFEPPTREHYLASNLTCLPSQPTSHDSSSSMQITRPPKWLSLKALSTNHLFLIDKARASRSEPAGLRSHATKILPGGFVTYLSVSTWNV